MLQVTKQSNCLQSLAKTLHYHHKRGKKPINVLSLMKWYINNSIKRYLLTISYLKLCFAPTQSKKDFCKQKKRSIQYLNQKNTLRRLSNKANFCLVYFCFLRSKQNNKLIVISLVVIKLGSVCVHACMYVSQRPISFARFLDTDLFYYSQ